GSPTARRPGCRPSRLTERDERRDRPDFVGRRARRLRLGVHLGEAHVRGPAGGPLEDRRETLAQTAPAGPEVDQDDPADGPALGEVVLRQRGDAHGPSTPRFWSSRYTKIRAFAGTSAAGTGGTIGNREQPALVAVGDRRSGRSRCWDRGEVAPGPPDRSRPAAAR